MSLLLSSEDLNEFVENLMELKADVCSGFCVDDANGLAFESITGPVFISTFDEGDENSSSLLMVENGLNVLDVLVFVDVVALKFRFRAGFGRYLNFEVELGCSPIEWDDIG